MNKKELSERDICTKYITPAIKQAGWDIFREEYSFTNGKIIIKGDKIVRGERKRADYILFYKPNIPIAIIEAKDNKHSIGSGLQQGIEYGEILDIPFVFSSNGDGFILHDRTGQLEEIEKELPIDGFPSPIELWNTYKRWKGINKNEEEIITQEYHLEEKGKVPRYYQQVAINKAVEAVVKGQDRILLVMATGTGKTFVASQIIYKLWKSKAKKRILFLADRNILVDQARNNDFKKFKDIMTKVTKRNIDTSYEVYLALYQGLSGNEDWKNIYKQFSRDFFDLIVVDECHRGSAREDSAWREILEYFSTASQIGMTATPKETKEVSNIDYFGEPVYTYSLKQGIDDGFLAPYKVVRISIDKDVEGWRPTKGMKDKYGHNVPDRIYNVTDHDRNIVIDDRTRLVAKKVSEFLKNSGDRFAKSIIFCVDIDHAERMRMALANENSDLMIKNPYYILKITGDDDIGKKQLDNFIDPASKYPVIATTSKLMTTGVDAQTCKLIVLDSHIKSMTEFKQIIGRGTRIREDYGKHYFTIMDFRHVTHLFADPDFDGEPVQIYEPKLETELKIKEAKKVEKEEIIYDTKSSVDIIRETSDKPRKYYINNLKVSVLNERVQYYDKDGKLITETLNDFTKKTLQEEYRSLNDFLKKWNTAEKKSAILNELREQGVLIDELKHEVGKDFDEFDLICHVAFDKKPLTRKERADNVKKRDYFTKYGEKARAVINALLDKYTDEGIEDMEDLKVLKVNPLRDFGTPVEIINFFGGKEQYFEAIHELENHIYSGGGQIGNIGSY
ncbi:DEAD/DEAH box helicase family protein [Candidatus Woesearchaeota archaeon]|nr:DEAD/DEAH box helicase family protein [Candidatus Woesearchaeota archaeon]MBT5342707.1 DEAD/DEAH box helicase family protein [Candidatus Woesearchaeota archaeon]